MPSELLLFTLNKEPSITTSQKTSHLNTFTQEYSRLKPNFYKPLSRFNDKNGYYKEHPFHH
ncbi:hypothetical protein [Treponema pectinovorum]|uniref:hypothetical protein n=1 Tax=Treponema pectinovorum TaxID=164 RepID=UPI0011CB9C7C|nr:hypothetical protein [Treponema pectinovorum]